MKKTGFLMMDGSREKKGFTLVELLTVLAIITMLVGLLVPSLNVVRNAAKDTRQKAQLATIGSALTTFRNDYGDYPPSFWPLPPDPHTNYCGAQKLAEALVGWDLMGFHPQSDFRANGVNDSGVFVYDTTDPILFSQRRGRYLELATTDAFKLGDLFANTGVLEANTFVLCDVYGAKRVTIGDRTVKAGAPILYYRANPGGTSITDIYRFRDNAEIVVTLGRVTDGEPHWLGETALARTQFYVDPPGTGYIQDPRVSLAWPYRPDSYLLITAGADGLYGTGDDICNFGN